MALRRLIFLTSVLISAGCGGGSEGDPPQPSNTAPGPTAENPPTSNTQSPPTTHKATPEEIAAWEKRRDWMLVQLNTAGIVAEYLSYRGDTGRLAPLQRKRGDMVSDIKRVREEAAQNKIQLIMPEHLIPGDQVLAINGKTLVDMPRPEAAKLLAMYLKSELRKGAITRIRFRRSATDYDLILDWKEVPREVTNLITAANVTIETPSAEPIKPKPSPSGGETTKPKPRPIRPEPEKEVKLSGELLDLARKALEDTHPYYLKELSSAERSRIDTIIKTGKGTKDDIDLLQDRLIGDVRILAESEQEEIKERIGELSAEGSGGATEDVLHLKDGSRKTGRLVKETADSIVFEMTFGGIKGSRTYKKSDVLRVQKGAGAGAGFDGKLKEAGDRKSKLGELFAWCVKNKLDHQARLVAWRILFVDPSSDSPRQHLGYRISENGIWSLEEELEATEGKFRFEGKLLTLEELERRLKAKNYVKLPDGKWYSRKRWHYTINNLTKDAEKLDVVYVNAGLTTQVDIKESKKFSLEEREWVDSYKLVARGKHISALPGRKSNFAEGKVQLKIQPPGPVISCKIRAVGRVIIPKAQLRVLAFGLKKRQAKTLYHLSAEGKNEKTHDVSKVLFGEETIIVEAQMESPYIEILGSFAWFLPGNRKDRKLFHVTCEIGAPLVRINKLIGNAAPSGESDNADASKGDIQEQIRNAAKDVLSKSSEFANVTREMTRRTGALKYSGPFRVPERFKHITKHIVSPAKFSLTTLNPSVQNEINVAWSRLTPELQEEFAFIYGLWNAKENSK